MNRESPNHAEQLAGRIQSNRGMAILLFCFYCSVLTFWFSNVVELIRPGVIIFCCLLAWGSLKVNANWIFIGEVIVLLAKHGWESPNVDLVPSLWLGYLGIMLFILRARYQSIHTELCRTAQLYLSEKQDAFQKLSIQILLQLSLSLLFGLVFVGMGYLLLAYSPFGGAGNTWVDWSLSRNEAMWPGASVVSILVGAVVLLREWNWRRMSSSQASVYLRADRMSWQYRDLSRIVKLMQRDKSKSGRV